MTRILMAEATDYRAPMRVGSHALSRQFVAAGASVMWVGTPLYPHTFLHERDAATRRRIEVWRAGGVTRDSVTEYYPFTLLPVLNRPLLRSRAVATMTLQATCPPIEGVLRHRGFAEPDVLWLSASRFSYPLLTMVRAKKRAYRMSDDWAAFPEVPRSLIDLEARIIDRVDAVFVTGRVLEERVRARRPDVIYLPNGVDDMFFETPRGEDEMAAHYPRPRVVFAGTLGDWIDYEAVVETARRSPRASILLVGAGGSARGREFPANVHVTGPVPYEQLPAVLHACDIGIVPFLRTPRTEAASSNKLFQYLACGLPVVASRTAEFDRTGAPVTLCDGAAEFAQAVAASLERIGADDTTGRAQRSAADDAAGRAQRVAFAREHTWSRRADVVRQTLGF